MKLLDKFKALTPRNKFLAGFVVFVVVGFFVGQLQNWF